MIKTKKYFLNSEQDFFSLDEMQNLDELKSNKDLDIIISFENLHLLEHCNNIHFLIITSGYISDLSDFAFLYKHSELQGLYLDYYEDEGYTDYSVDIGFFTNLEILISKTSFNFYNIELCKKLLTVKVTEWLHTDLTLFKNLQIESLMITNGKNLKSFTGIESASPKILSVSYAKIKSIAVISQLNRLVMLELDHCPYIMDYFLLESNSIEVLVLTGNGKINSLGFILKMKTLKRAIIGMSIIDGDLSSLCSLEHATVFPSKKNYSCKNSELPKSANKYYLKSVPKYRYVFGNRF